jgi:hypothetical protein
MSGLTSYYDANEADRQQLTVDMLIAAYEERGREGLIGASFGLRVIASLAVNLLSVVTQQTPQATLQIVGRGFEEQLAKYEGG